MRRYARLSGWTLALLTGMAGAGALEAQEGTERAHGGCFPARPLPECRSWFVFEMQGAFPVAATRRIVQFGDGSRLTQPDFEARLEWNLGYMVNVGPTVAVGGVVTLGTGAHSPLTGLRARGRWWPDRDVALEIEGGLIRSAAAGHRPYGVTGATADARLVLHERGALFVRWDGLDLQADDWGDPGGASHALMLGVGLNNRLAVYGTLATGLVWAVLVGTFVAQAQ